MSVAILQRTPRGARGGGEIGFQISPHQGGFRGNPPALRTKFGSLAAHRRLSLRESRASFAERKATIRSLTTLVMIGEHAPQWRRHCAPGGRAFMKLHCRRAAVRGGSLDVLRKVHSSER